MTMAVRGKPAIDHSDVTDASGACRPDDGSANLGPILRAGIDFEVVEKAVNDVAAGLGIDAEAVAPHVDDVDVAHLQAADVLHEDADLAGIVAAHLDVLEPHILREAGRPHEYGRGVAVWVARIELAPAHIIYVLPRPAVDPNHAKEGAPEHAIFDPAIVVVGPMDQGTAAAVLTVAQDKLNAAQTGIGGVAGPGADRDHVGGGRIRDRGDRRIRAVTDKADVGADGNGALQHQRPRTQIDRRRAAHCRDGMTDRILNALGIVTSTAQRAACVVGEAPRVEIGRRRRRVPGRQSCRGGYGHRGGKNGAAACFAGKPPFRPGGPRRGCVSFRAV